MKYRTIQFTLPGHPQTFKPLRFHRGRNVYAGHSKEMGLAKMQIGLQKPAGGPVSGKAVTLDVRLYFKRAKSHYKKDGTLKANAPKHVLKTPDVDNCLKFVQDALEPTVIENDKLIVSATVTKMWCSSASEERTEIELLVYHD